MLNTRSREKYSILYSISAYFQYYIQYYIQFVAVGICSLFSGEIQYYIHFSYILYSFFLPKNNMHIRIQHVGLYLLFYHQARSRASSPWPGKGLFLFIDGYRSVTCIRLPAIRLAREWLGATGLTRMKLAEVNPWVACWLFVVIAF